MIWWRFWPSHRSLLWFVAEHVEEDMFGLFHRLKAHRPTPTDCYRSLVACLSKFYEYWTHRKSKSQQNHHCTSKLHMQSVKPRFWRYACHIQTDLNTDKPNLTLHFPGPLTILKANVKQIKWTVVEICVPQTDRQLVGTVYPRILEL